jgi:hypothetical protein
VTGREIILKAAVEKCSISTSDAERIAVAISGFGYVCVPLEPTKTMLDEAWAEAHEESATGVWSAMVKAAQSIGNSDSGNG